MVGGAPGGAPPPPAQALTVGTGLMAPVAGSSGEQGREGWHAGVPPAHQQLLYAGHLTLQRVGTAGDFGKRWGPGWGHPGRGLQPRWLGLGQILAGGPTAAMVWGWEGPNATVQGSSQRATGWGGEGKSGTLGCAWLSPFPLFLASWPRPGSTLGQDFYHGLSPTCPASPPHLPMGQGEICSCVAPVPTGDWHQDGTQGLAPAAVIERSKVSGGCGAGGDLSLSP